MALKLIVNVLECKDSIDNSDDSKLKNIGVSLYYPDNSIQTNIGDEIKFKTTFKIPVDFKNPASFPYKTWLASNGISLTGSVQKDWLTIINSDEKIYSKIQNTISTAIEKSKSINNDTKTFINALLTGKKTNPSDKLYEYFRKTGTIHILAISGLHVGFVALIALLIAGVPAFFYPKIYNILPKQLLTIYIGIPLIWFYIFTAGFPPSAIRAGIMITIGILVLSRGFITHNLSVLIITAMIMASIFPLISFNVSFQLSAMAVLGIILIAPKFEYNKKNKFIRYIEQILVISTAALIFTAPLVAKNFHEVSLMGIISNIIAIPYTGIIIFPTAIISSLVSFISQNVAVFLFTLTNNIALPLIYFLNKISDYSSNYILKLSPTDYEILAYYILLFTVIFWKKLKYIRILSILIILIFSIFSLVKYNTYKFEAVFFDVGQGDSTLLTFSNGKKVLIDAGGTKSDDFDIGERIIAPALWNLGIRKIDDLIITHPHMDHYKGMGFIAKNFSPKRIWTNGLRAPETEIEDWNKFKKTINDLKMESFTANSNTEPLIFGSGSIEFIYPDKNIKGIKNINDSSLVIVARENDKCIMIAGDIEVDVESYILAKYQNLKCDILKVAHHGSNTSSSYNFLKAVNPNYAVISVGRQNQYKMPSEETIKRLDDLKIKIKRTDLDGMVRILP